MQSLVRDSAGEGEANLPARAKAAHGLDGNALIMAYLERQEQGDPVHAWPL